MNNVLEVKLKYKYENNKAGGGQRNLRVNSEVTVQKIDELIDNLKTVVRYYETVQKLMNGILIDVYYNDIIAKSNRIREVLKPIGKKPNDLIVGARFSNAPTGQENHIITYYVDKETINSSIDKLIIVKQFISDKLNGRAIPANFNEPDNVLSYAGYYYKGNEIKKNSIRDIVVDCSVIESFSYPNVTAEEYKESFLITFFQTEKSVSEILEKLNIDYIQYQYSFYGKDTISVTWQLYQLLLEEVPYMISMISSDLSKVVFDNNGETINEYSPIISDPTVEPVIGVIDNLFDERVYFNKWVDNRDYLDEFEQIDIEDADRDHGTAVASIIVDGPRLNPWLDDGCGRFRVRHFGVCENKISVSRLIKKIKSIVEANPDIHVWNLSLGTEDEVSKNFISYDGFILDELQYQKNVIFVISGTNDNRADKQGYLRVGSPADSLNGVVVNSVKRNGTPASYSRKGNVLSFFNKPDVSYYGGDYEKEERIFAYTSKGKEEVYGTSFAAPWISRKLCYLIDVMGLSREVAKALIIDAAAGWDYKISTYKNKDLLGYGVVPIKINDILTSDNNEMKFILYGTSQSYKTANYQIPIPKDSDDKYPYISRATLCYFPECSRSQGVDYTLRELSLKFGRVKMNGTIEDINDNVQDENGFYTDERKSRQDFRKWENTKFISKILKNNKSLKSYNDRFWGFSITSKERLDTAMKKDLNFGAVVTLREINGVNRIQDFITACTIRGYIVNEIDIQNRIDIYNSNQEEIIFD